VFFGFHILILEAVNVWSKFTIHGTKSSQQRIRRYDLTG